MPIFDRAEEATFFAKYFSQFITNGVFANPSTNLQVLASEGMKLIVDVGVCFINGYMGWAETAEEFELAESGTQPRIDRIVARLDLVDRTINLFVKQGNELGNPVPPELQRNYDIYEIALADVRVNGNAVEIKQENITDLRLDTELCGVVVNQLDHVDTTTIFNQYQDWFKNITSNAIIAFNDWFQTIQDILDSDTAGHLLNLINTKADKKRIYNLTIDNNWDGAEAPFSKVIPISGLKNNDFITVYPILSENLENRKTENSEYNKISLVDSAEGELKLICDTDKPDITLNIRVEIDNDSSTITNNDNASNLEFLVETENFDTNKTYHLQDEKTIETITNMTDDENNNTDLIVEELK